MTHDVKTGLSNKRPQRGPIAWMAENPVAANLLLFVLFAGGVLGLFQTKQEVFPEFSLDLVLIQVPYPGASPAEVEQGILLAAEEAVRGLEGVKRVTSTAQESVGTVSVELLLDANPDKVLNDVKSAVDRITSFPEEAERATVSLALRRREVISLILFGDQEQSALHALAETARAGLLELPEVTQVEVSGIPPLEVSIDIRREVLEQYGLTLSEVARQVGLASVERPGGELDTRGGKLLMRVADRKERAIDLSSLVIRSNRTGGQVTLGELAALRDGFVETDQASFYQGKRAVRLTAYRVGDETPSSVARAVRRFAESLQEELPGPVEVAIWGDDSELLQARIDLLVSNAVMGLILVLVILALFLEVRLGFWVALGIPTSFLGAFLLMPGLDLSINMVSLFGLIITLGLVVDDAIVVGEHAHEKIQQGESPMRAAISGAREMAVPVTFAILTTLAAFAPLLFVPGVLGKIFRILPLVVGAILVISWVESFFILPAHIGHLRAGPSQNPILRRIDRVQAAVSRALQRFTSSYYQPLLEATLRHRYLSVAMAVSMLIATIGTVAGGLVPFSFFPDLEGDKVTAAARLPYGTPVSETEKVRRALEDAANASLEDFGGALYARGMFTRLGEGAAAQGPNGGGSESGSHLVTVEMNLVPSEDRDFSSAEFAAAWQKHLPPIAGLEALTISGASGPGAGAPIAVQLSSRDEDTLAAAAVEVEDILRSFSELTDIDNGYSTGKPQLDFHLLPTARNLGLTSAEVAQQIRAAFFGAEALREQRGRNEVKVMVRLPKSQRQSEYDLEDLRVRTPAGGYVPLSYVARFDRGRAPTSIRREDGKRIVDITARLAAGTPSPQPVLENLRSEVFPSLREKFPNLGVDLVGQQRSQGETFASLGQNFLFALFIIYALLAVPFRSYLQPAIVMAAIPFGIVGAILGHLVMGYGLSLISMFGIIALSGVVVNDSLVLIDATNRGRQDGLSAWDAIVFGGTRRLRPILLTSLTTFFGLMPMIFEKSVQARFLIPMAISLGFGVMFATFIALLIVPALYLILEDIQRLFATKTTAEKT